MRSFVVALLLVAVVVVLCPDTEASSLARNGICPCPRIYRPVCGTDEKTYSNQCLLKCQAASPRGRSIGLRILHEGSCNGARVQILEEAPLE
uniref:Putative kazal domain-containing peptide n=1 Tax=Anopheles marajoara TaxID=58244 RepID=A0A2M4C4V5_9DIPT